MYSKHVDAPTAEPGSQANAQSASSYESTISPSTSTHLASNEASQLSTLESQLQIETPASAVSDRSSQDQSSESRPIIVQKSQQRGPMSGRGLASFPRNELSVLDMNVTNRIVAHNAGLDGEYLHGQKRTASGDIKSEGAGSPISPVDNSSRRLVTRASISSNGTQVGELSAQLRTRLSYAMVKVQRGWETRTISDLESLTSQHPSPVSTTATTASRPFDSPLTTPITYLTDRPTFAQSSERSTATPETIHTTAHLQNGTATLDYAYPRSPSDPVYSPDHPTRTYEQFWREHPSTSRHPHNLTGPSLAPPVDIQPRRANHLSQNPYQSLSLHTNLTSVRPMTTILSTPPHRRAPAVRTPSQKAKMEKDAVETLLFMSSPGNSAMRAPRTLGSPSAKKVGFAAHTTTKAAGDGFSSDEDAPTSAAGSRAGGVRLSPTSSPLALPARLGLALAVRGGGVRVGLRPGDEIDRLLDQMARAEQDGGGDSSSDEDVPVVTRGFVPV